MPFFRQVISLRHGAPRRRPALAGSLALLLLLTPPVFAGPLDPPPPEVLDEARAIIAQMKSADRGPYLRIRWFCNDGSSQPPVAYACRDRGGGRQYAEYSPARERLAVLGWPIGTIFAALDWDTLWEGDGPHRRLRGIPLERYLIDVDDGWVLRRAQHYRGRVQIEDEEYTGRALLLSLMAQRDWLAGHFLATREVVRAMPHGTGEDLTRVIRRHAQDIAEKDDSFERLRVETHTAPSAASATRIRAWASAPGRNPDLAREAEILAADIDRLYGSAGRAERLAAGRARLTRFKAGAPVLRRLVSVHGESGLAELARLSSAMYTMRKLAIDPASTPELRLALFDLLSELEAEVRVQAGEIARGVDLTRTELFGVAAALNEAAFGTGLVSAGELAAVAAVLARPQRELSLPLDEYVEATRTLNLVSTWAVGSTRYEFAEVLVRYAALEPRATQFVDDLLRGSVLLPMAEVSARLSADAQHLAGVQRRMFAHPAPSLLALNPGIARGPLRVLDEQALATQPIAVKREDIVVLPETAAELPPVAGVMTVGESNPLSHIQLLARNFGIPNLSITPAQYRRLKQHDGERVLLVAGSDGSVFIGAENETAPARSDARPAADSEEKFAVARPDLSVRRAIPLVDLHRSLSGKIVGPKAANLGELNRLFPGRVSPALALPFGVFDEQTTRGDNSARARLDGVYLAARQNRITADELVAELDSIRQSIAGLRLREPLESDLVPLMEKEFGAPGSYGLFIRSDTNVEDLPGFSGAGLSLTLPNVVGLEAQLEAIPKVWASVLSPRAIAWRSNLMQQPENIYASVLLMKSVPSDKSGVLVTTDVTNRGAGLTVSTAWGVGGAVAGETTETLVLRPDGSERLLSEAKAPYRRALDPKGGLRWQPARDGAVLTVAEKRQLRALADEVERKAVPAMNAQGQELPWDIEFGFVAGELTLFQIRPLVERGQARADQLLSSLLPARVQREEMVVLGDPPVRQTDEDGNALP